MNKDIELIKDLFTDITDEYEMVDCSSEPKEIDGQFTTGLKPNGISYYIKPFVEDYGEIIKGFKQFEKNIDDIVIMIKISPDIISKMKPVEHWKEHGFKGPRLLIERLNDDLHVFTNRCSRHGFKYDISSTMDRRYGYYYTIVLSKNNP